MTFTADIALLITAVLSADAADRDDAVDALTDACRDLAFDGDPDTALRALELAGLS